MTLVIESSSVEAIRAISEFAKSFSVKIRVDETKSTVSPGEAQGRLKNLQAFKGGLRKYQSTYTFNKHDWYLQ